MTKKSEVRPYFKRIKDWKTRNMIMLYLEARDIFLTQGKRGPEGISISFDCLRKLCNMFYEIKEDHHLLYKRLLDPRKKKFEKADKFVPNEIDIRFMNNIGLLFHKLMVARELKYQTKHYAQKDTIFRRNEENLRIHLNNIAALFEEGIEIVKALILNNRGNVLLLTLLLENVELTRNQLGDEARSVIQQFAADHSLDDVYFSVGSYYLSCGRPERAKKMFESALHENAGHTQAKRQLSKLSTLVA